MKTIVYTVRGDAGLRDQLRPAAAILARGGLVAFPTETVYGLGANAFDATAVGRIFEAKERPADDPLIVHVAAFDQVEQVATIPAGRHRVVETLAARFWPGPLTLVLERKPCIPPRVTAGLDTVAVRVPAHPVARTLVELAGVPVAAPSANRFERTSPTRADHVLHDLDGRIDAVIDGGPTPVGIESTIVDVTGDVPVLLRPGGITLEALQDAVGTIALHPGARGAGTRGQAIAPGMKPRHYAPLARLVLVEGTDDGAVSRLVEATARAHVAGGKATGIIVTGGHAGVDGAFVRQLGPDPPAIARDLYDALREMDARGVEVIVAGCTPEAGLGLAIMNRLRKAAAEVIHA